MYLHSPSLKMHFFWTLNHYRLTDKIVNLIKLMTKQKKNIQLIWKNFQAGDKEAFAFLYNLYVDVMFSYGTKISNSSDMVKDSIQEVFLDLYLKKEKNKTNPNNLKFYLLLALKRNLIKKLKKNRRLMVTNEPNDNLFEPEYSIEKDIIEREENFERNKRVADALKLLPSRQKEALFLRFNESLEYQEISKLLNISVESVRKQVYRALKTVREKFKKESLLLWIFFPQKK